MKKILDFAMIGTWYWMPPEVHQILKERKQKMVSIILHPSLMFIVAVWLGCINCRDHYTLLMCKMFFDEDGLQQYNLWFYPIIRDLKSDVVGSGSGCHTREREMISANFSSWCLIFIVSVGTVWICLSNLSIAEFRKWIQNWKIWQVDPNSYPSSTEIVLELKQFVEAIEVSGAISLFVPFWIGWGVRWGNIFSRGIYIR